MKLSIVLLLFMIGLLNAEHCPPNAGEALLDSNKENLYDCIPRVLWNYYKSNGCCYNNIAECNNIADAWDSKPASKVVRLCNYNKQKDANVEILSKHGNSNRKALKSIKNRHTHN